MRVAIIIPIFNEEEVLPELIKQLTLVVKALDGVDVRVLFVDDGSHDRSVSIIEAAVQSAPYYMSCLRLSRNFGHQAAISAGIFEAEGDAYVLMDGDLQDPPALIPELIHAWENGADVVLAERTSRKETPVRLFLMNLYHRYAHLLSDMRMPSNVGLYCLMSAPAMEAVRSLNERNRYFPGLREWIGFESVRVFYDRNERFAGEPKQDFRRLLRLALDSIFSYSYAPLRLVTYVGSVVSLFGFSLGIFFAAKRLLGLEVADTGFTTIIVMIALLGGFQLIALGVLGEYLARTYDEAKGRPLYVVKSRINAPCRDA